MLKFRSEPSPSRSDAMDRCSNCPATQDACVAITSNHRRYCDLVNPNHPAYNPEYLPIVQSKSSSTPELKPQPPESPPGILTLAKNLGTAIVHHAIDGSRIAPVEIQAERKALCFACDHHDHEIDRCNACGCVAMNLKRSWASSACPLDPPKWLAV